MYKMSVLVTTFNQPFPALFSTLNSLVEQDFDSFEIIIADDASTSNPEAAIRNYFAEKEFEHFKIVVNKENLGTVRNLVSGLEVAQGEYVKDIGAGDMLFSANTLREMYEFAQSNDIKLAFGRIMTFTNTIQGRVIHRFEAPTNPHIYEGSNELNQHVRQQVLHSDWIPGGALFFRRDFLLDYWVCLAAEYNIRYCEDLVSPLVSFTEQIRFFDNVVLWYEWGVGISNSGSTVAKQRMYKDHTNFFSKLVEQYGSHPWVRSAANRFKIKRFIALHTPLYSLAQSLSAKRYLSRNGALQEHEEQDGRAFLDRCLVVSEISHSD